MKNYLRLCLAAIGCAALMAGIPLTASAQWGSSGGSSGGGSSGGGYYAGYGSSGGSSGGYYGGSSGGYGVGPIRHVLAGLHQHLHHKIHAHHAMRHAYAYYGSSGGGSSGGSSGGGSSGGYVRRHSYYSVGGSSGGGSSGGGSSGGGATMSSYRHADMGYSWSDSSIGYGGSSFSNYSTPGYRGADSYYQPDSNDGVQSAGLSAYNSIFKSDEVHISVSVPEETRLFVNGNVTKSGGDLRHFVSRGLNPDSSYRFEIRAELDRNGETITDSKTLTLSAGQQEMVSFSMVDADSKAVTALKLNVPENAQVVLAGNNTTSKGDVRTYRTTELAVGEVWEDYKIVVTANGETREQTLRLIGGDQIELSFQFGPKDSESSNEGSQSRVASR